MWRNPKNTAFQSLSSPPAVFREMTSLLSQCSMVHSRTNFPTNNPLRRPRSQSRAFSAKKPWEAAWSLSSTTAQLRPRAWCRTLTGSALTSYASILQQLWQVYPNCKRPLWVIYWYFPCYKRGSFTGGCAGLLNFLNASHIRWMVVFCRKQCNLGCITMAVFQAVHCSYHLDEFMLFPPHIMS